MKSNFFAHLRDDVPASIVVFLVAMPLCLGIALASGAPIFSGLIAGIVGGMIVALASGSPLGVSGPAAGLIVIVLSAIEELGSFEIFLYATMVAGIFQVILGFLKAGVIGYYFPSSVIKGMLSGIGITIILKQIPHAVGYDKDPEGDLAFRQVDGKNTFSEIFNMMDYVSYGAVIIVLVSLLILILWEQPFVKRFSFTKIVQGPLVAVVAGVVLNMVFVGTTYQLDGEHLVQIPVAESFNDFLGQFSLPDFSHWQDPDVYIIAATIAVVASLETLLCVEATDKLDPQKRVTPTNRELRAQGLGNFVSGMIGGLPITQVIVRSSANIQSGGKTKASAFIHGVLLLVSVITIPGIVNMIPLASLAAILLVVGYKLAKPALFVEMFKKGPTQYVPFIITIAGILLTDLLVGIGLGLAVAIVQILYNNFRTPYHFHPEDHEEGEPINIKLSEDVSFLNKASILKTLDGLPNGSHIIIDASKTRTVHPDVVEIFQDFATNAKTKDIQFEVVGLETRVLDNPVDKFGRFVLKK